MWMWRSKPWGVGSMWFRRIAAHFMLGPLCKTPVPNDHKEKNLGIVFKEKHYSSSWFPCFEVNIYVYILIYIYIYIVQTSHFCLFSQTFPFLSICFLGVEINILYTSPCFVSLRFTWLPNNARRSQRSWCRSNLPRTALGKMGQCRVCCFFHVSGHEFLPKNRIKKHHF